MQIDGQTVLPYGAKSYPERLKRLSDAPAVLFAKGSLCQLRDAERRIAVVGSRGVCEEALHAAWTFGLKLADRGVDVVSGLAVGCDASAHEGCLAAVGTGAAVAVLPGGLDDVVPPCTEGFARRVLEAGGALVSEEPPETKVEAWSFVRRDRLIAALASRLVVVQTGTSGGTLRRKARRAAHLVPPPQCP